MRYELVDLQLFLNIVDEGSITQGAAKSNLSLAAASTRITLLEKRLNVELLSRSRSGAKVTPAGANLVRHARTIISQAALLDGDMREYSGGIRGQVRLLSNTNALTEFLPKALGAFLARNPDIGIDLREKLSREIVVAVAEGETDIGIVAGTVESRAITSYRFADDRLVLITPAAHEFARKKQIALSDALELPFVGLHETSAIQSFIRGVAEELGQHLRLRMKLMSFDAVCQLVEAGAGVAVVPRTAARRYARLMKIGIVELKDVWAQRELRVCINSTTKLPAHAMLLLNHLREAAAARTRG
jgi:DNA-binding transcriptional LysR family regulator